jgi:hypothetical protein
MPRHRTPQFQPGLLFGTGPKNVAVLLLRPRPRKCGHVQEIRQDHTHPYSLVSQKMNGTGALRQFVPKAIRPSPRVAFWRKRRPSTASVPPSRRRDGEVWVRPIFSHADPAAHRCHPSFRSRSRQNFFANLRCYFGDVPPWADQGKHECEPYSGRRALLIWRRRLTLT